MSHRLARFIAGGMAVALSLCALSQAARAVTEGQTYIQPAARNREASSFTVFTCDGAGENHRIYYLYAYTNRPPGSPLYRLVIPPNWGQSVGHRDWPDRNLLLDFIARGCHSIVGAPPR